MRRACVVAVLAAWCVLSGVANAQSRTARADGVAAMDSAEALLAESSVAPARWSALGVALYESGRYRESIASFERALQLRSDAAPEDAWNIARGYAKLGNTKQALRWLSHARQFGFRDELAMRAEPAFESFRADPRFRALMRPSSCKPCGARTIHATVVT